MSTPQEDLDKVSVLAKENDDLRQRLAHLENRLHQVESQDSPATNNAGEVQKHRRESQEHAWDLLQRALSVGAKQVVDALFVNPYLQMEAIVQEKRSRLLAEEAEAIALKEQEELAQPSTSPQSDAQVVCGLTLNIDSVSGIPGNDEFLGEMKIVKSDFFVVCQVLSSTGKVKQTHTTKVVASPQGTPVFKESVNISIAWTDVIKFSLHVSFLRSKLLEKGIALELGRVEVTVPELLCREFARFWFANADTKVVLFDRMLENPCKIAVSWTTNEVTPAYSFLAGHWVWGSKSTTKANQATPRQGSFQGFNDTMADFTLNDSDVDELEDEEHGSVEREMEIHNKSETQSLSSKASSTAAKLKKRLSARSKGSKKGTNATNRHSLDIDQLSPSRSFHHRQLPREWNIKLEEVRTMERERATALRKFTKHCMVCTRGTRGDVQPFIALAIGLAEKHGWLVTICTEPRYKELIERYQAKLSLPLGGGIQFRSSGGDTETRIMTPIAKWGMKQKSSVMQLLMLARSEREFFDSEPMLFYWAKHFRPDLLLFGFTLANIAVVLSESLRIPMIGFILQPTVIPSEQYPAVSSVGHSAASDPSTIAATAGRSAVRMMLTSTSAIANWRSRSTDSQEPASVAAEEPVSAAATAEEPAMQVGDGSTDEGEGGFVEEEAEASDRYRVKGHRLHGRVKHFMEHNPLDFTKRLNSIRRYRGLEAHTYRKNNYEIILEQNIPVVVPINATCFGGKPKDWTSNTVLTDFIFLRSGNVPRLEAKLVNFLMTSRSHNRPVLVMAFSSMPVSRELILSLACQILEKCESKPHIVALTGNLFATPISSKLSAKVEQYIASSTLLELKGAPFGRLFPQVSGVIMHGGLGTTAEALWAGVPCMVTGVLLMDQRFWGNRVHQLGVGPRPVHIQDLHHTVVPAVDKMMNPMSEWSVNARQLAASLELEKAGVEDASEDGVSENANTIVRLAQHCEPIKRHKGKPVSAAILANAAFSTIAADLRERLGVSGG